MAGAREIEVKITADTTEFEQQMQTVRRSLRKTTRAFASLNDAWERSLRRTRRLSRSRIRWYWRLWYRLVDWRHRKELA